MPGVDIEEVLARTVGEVEHAENHADVILAQGEEVVYGDSYRTWSILLADGDDALEAIDILVADPDVEEANWGTYRELTGGQTGGQTSGQPGGQTGGTAVGGGADTCPIPRWPGRHRSPSSA